MHLTSPRLDLELKTPQETLAWIESLPDEVKAEVSPAYIEKLKQATVPDPWSSMFAIRDRQTQAEVGSCAFKGPPDEHGAVEIAYGIDDAHRNQGYATEAAQALVAYAQSLSEVKVVRAHTKADGLASERVLAKCGFRFVREVIDPEDGLVNRWEIG